MAQPENTPWTLPGEDEPWSLSLVARVERDPAPAHTDVLVAAARAVVLLLTDERTTVPGGEFHDAVAAWRGQRIRKITRRARGVRWERTAQLPHVEARSGDAVVRAFAPHPRDDVPPLLAPLQVGGLDLTDPDDSPTPPTAPGLLTIRLHPGVRMSTGKAAAQVGHAAQLAWELLPAALTAPWALGGLGVRVLTGAPVLGAGERVDVRDGGFTEVPPGTVTASAGFEG
ncbi:hypothetical protein MO973_35925 [Paenibacillus sp. TRM 82003]|uniref:hypothetical protein n=1 Tax=Kineococcus sp. TRM81007 TaxID=2925831 RepID=UPI001F580FCA|nr:hypothetical protein [Kineococcus sp. TRM81007]MCI2240090.1 hypothetical protein [Kineococcus sp. TRM81007]MCI3925604.1 hypothetical protein [Paenibacillus sp. TRM 82003]